MEPPTTASNTTASGEVYSTALKSRVVYGEGVEPRVLNGVAGEAVRLNELKFIAVEFE